MKSPEILRRLVRRFGLLLALTVIGGAAGAVYGAMKTPTYTAKSYVVAIGDRHFTVTDEGYHELERPVGLRLPLGSLHLFPNTSFKGEHHA